MKGIIINMIKNIIFDIGDVLVDFRWRELMDELHLTEDEKNKFETSVFGSKWWHELDLGVMEEEEVIKNMRAENEEYAQAFDLVWENRGKLVKPRDYVIPFMDELHDKGYKIYLLSNYPKNLFTMHAQNGSFPFIDKVDGKVVSGFVNLVKPNADIYIYLVDKYGLKPEECVFIDDRQENIDAAKALNWQGIVYKSEEQAKKDLYKILNV